MDIIIGVGTLLVVLICMSLFLNFAPYGKEGLQALSGAACSTFLPQAFLSYAIGGVFDIPFFVQVGDTLGGLGGLAVGILTCIKLGISPVYALIVGLSLLKVKLLPAFIAAYAISFLIKQIEKRVPEGLDLIVVILVAPALTTLIALAIQPSVIAVLTQIGSAITAVGDANPYVLAIVLGAIIPVVGMTPLSSMVLTSLLGLVGTPMAIGALCCTGNSFANFVLFKKLGYGTKATPFAVAIEPLTQIDIIAEKPVQLYGSNAIIGMVNACIITAFGLVINVTGMATPIAGFIVAFGFNDTVPVLLCGLAVAFSSIVLAWLFATFFKNHDISVSVKMPALKRTTKQNA
ncbi:PTS sugar transporter subunit IIC [Macrococcoides goetzii]|uniref:PTS sugar transporter subunit IIC n=1 Tax=Macrococcoides goetzii TaxID=1891097 RepID=A0A395GAT3_9STAP|nr:PTS sugar transporter subunit IIC [Macrococcus goetzii]RAI81135.1 PTS sugar transporter subunit IIC [Macrococcus goetzii]